MSEPRDIAVEVKKDLETGDGNDDLPRKLKRTRPKFGKVSVPHTDFRFLAFRNIEAPNCVLPVNNLVGLAARGTTSEGS
jgi:hypothetical protein